MFFEVELNEVGYITGAVTDPTGLVVPSANVEATKAETEAVYSDPRGKLMPSRICQSALMY